MGLACEALNLETLLAYLRLSNWDCDIFLDCFSALCDRVKEAGDGLRLEVYDAMQRVWNRYYHIEEKVDLPFHLGLLAYKMEYYAEALEYFQSSISLYGPDTSTWHNMGLCHHRQRHWKEALEYMDQTLELDPGYEAARAMKIELQSRLSSCEKASSFPRSIPSPVTNGHRSP
jgi:tetratricopeptide (TPR) repeat protein